MGKKRSRLTAVFKWLAISIGIAIGILILAFLAVSTWPVIGAQGADLLRSLIGDKAVASLEMEMNQLQDQSQKLKYELGFEKLSAPWEIQLIPTSTPSPTAIPTPTPEVITPTNQPTIVLTATPTPLPTFTPTPSIWQPQALKPLGTAEGEGLWSPYVQDVESYTVAYRTFLQPDPSRPYSLVAVVAIDLKLTRLHFVLGTDEPEGENKQLRTGAIPAADRLPNVLLAAFNGGFKSKHGHFGAMADGIEALPPRDGLGTLIIYKDGGVRLVEWTPGMVILPSISSIRQNGPLVLQGGQINPRIYNNSPEDWGYTVNDVSPTIRTGIGLSKDENTLFYFCGPSLSMEMLAKTMQAAGAWNSIQLDINNYWALFVRFQASGDKVIPEALLPKFMIENINRYLWNYTRDYFYITSTVK